MLKNTDATYHRLANLLFKDQISKAIEMYVDDMLVKIQERKTILNNPFQL